MADHSFSGTGPGASGARRTVLLLQGGGALGSYQAGAYEALAKGGYEPAWVAGVSIGAINGALIAGNPPERRVERLREFWDRITATSALWPHTNAPVLEAVEQRVGAAAALLFGQPGFFRPRLPWEWFAEAPPVSFYDTTALQETLRRLVDFKLINRRTTRFSIGVVEVATGNMRYFDTGNGDVIEAEHVAASGALPPGFSAVTIDRVAYWDGGLVSNTPLQYVMDQQPRQDSLMFQLDLFPSRGLLPMNLDEVAEREKDIRFSSRTRTGTTDAQRRQNMRRQIMAFLEKLPAGLRDDAVAQYFRAHACPARIDVVQLIYRPVEPQGSQKDFQFDRGTIERRWDEGRADAEATLQAAPWKAPPAPEEGLRTFDVLKPA